MNGTITAAEPVVRGAKAPTPKSVCQFTVIGAGPYGLSIAAHLRGKGIQTRTFGDAMSFWRGNMPAGMKLRSQWKASHLSAPGGRYSLDEFVTSGGMKFAEPIPLEDFIRYGEWFQSQAVPDLDRRKVCSVESAGDRFRIRLEDGEVFESANVVIAAGLQHQAMFPPEFQDISRNLVSHTADEVDLGRFKGRHVAVIGRGQSAMESAALLAEAGAAVDVICNGPVKWLSSEDLGLPSKKSVLRTIVSEMKAPGGVGPFPLDWLAQTPGIVRLLPKKLRGRFSKRCLRAAAAGWLVSRMDGVCINPGVKVIRARVQEGSLVLDMDNGSRSVVDHALLATGYKLDISKPGILSAELLDRVQLQPRTGCPVLSSHLESSVRGLHFAGSSAVPSYGPLMRFVAGVDYAAQSIAQGAVSRNK